MVQVLFASVKTRYFTPPPVVSGVSLQPSIAAVNSNGTVNGLSPGWAGFKFTNITTGCSAELNNIVQVKSRPVISLAGPGVICGGSTTNLLPSTDGTWLSLDPAIALVNNNGIVTGMNIGNARFRFTDFTTGCTSSQNIQITVISDPTITLDGPDKICIGGHTQLLPIRVVYGNQQIPQCLRLPMKV